MANEIENYINQLFAQEDDALQHIRAESKRNGLPEISVTPHEGALLQMLLRAVGAKKAVEIGALGGYSGTWLARGLPADGVLYTLELSGKHAEVARNNFQRAGISDRVKLIEGDAQKSLQKLSAEGPFDFVFIDADKGGYPAYFAWAAKNLRSGGMVTAHNALREGRVINPQSDDEKAIADFNRTLAEHPDFYGLVLNIGDGTAVGIRK
ncbi:MAG: O-methyltransferase [Caldilineaceae bacterium]